MPIAGEAQAARDGNIAIQEEYDAAIAAATIEAWELFIARHPAHELAKPAREELEQLRAINDG